MKSMMHKLEDFLELGGIKKDICLLIIGGISVVLSLLESRFQFRIFPFDAA